MEEIKLTQEEFDKLPEYSLTYPTGATIGKKWKCNWKLTGRWFLCEYVEHEDLKKVGILSTRIVISNTPVGDETPPQA